MSSVLDCDSHLGSEVPGGAAATEVRIDQLSNSDPLIIGTEYTVQIRTVNRWTGLFKTFDNLAPLNQDRVEGRRRCVGQCNPGRRTALATAEC